MAVRNINMEAPRPTTASAERFERLLEAGRVERGAISSITEMSMCPAYQHIIGMGETAVPLIFGRLAEEGDDPDQWFWALKSITEADPVPEEDRGDFLAMSRAWLQWGSEHGYAG
jgi:hypothetical protein